MFGHVPWWNADYTPDECYQELLRSIEELAESEVAKAFADELFVTLVWCSNFTEGTLPNSITELDTFKLLQHHLNALDASEPCDSAALCEWAADGGTSEGEVQAQLVQHLRAFKFADQMAKKNGTITVEFVKQVHAILMKGAKGVEPGEFRCGPVYSGTGYVYPPASYVPTSLERAIDRFNKDSTDCFLARIARLFYDLLIIHPFSDGNGRVSRLIAVYAIRVIGKVPFFCNLKAQHVVNGHSRSRDHYIQVLKYADKHGQNTSRIATFLLECIDANMKNLKSWLYLLG
jgi:fido (protein-threonine AMPylation protein)